LATGLSKTGIAGLGGVAVALLPPLLLCADMFGVAFVPEARGAAAVVEGWC
jgi:hypothetical protein